MGGNPTFSTSIYFIVYSILFDGSLQWFRDYKWLVMKELLSTWYIWQVWLFWQCILRMMSLLPLNLKQTIFCHLVGFQASPPRWQQDNGTSRSQGPSLPSPPRQMIETSLNIRRAKLDEHFKLQICGVSIICTIPTTPFSLSWVDQALSELSLSSPHFRSTCKLEYWYVWSNENYEYPKYIFLCKGKGSKILWWMYKRQGNTWPTKTLNMIRILTGLTTKAAVMLMMNLLACISSPCYSEFIKGRGKLGPKKSWHWRG